MMDAEDLKCYRTNYSRDWLEMSDRRSVFPIDGSIAAIHALCDEVERSHALLRECEEALKHISVDADKYALPDCCAKAKYLENHYDEIAREALAKLSTDPTEQGAG